MANQLAAIHTVFSQELLLEKVLDYAMYDDGVFTCADDIRSIRMVQKGWKEIISKVIFKHRDPLYMLTLSADNSLNESRQVAEANGKILDRFVSFWTRNVTKPVSTFGLCIMQEVFRMENYNSLDACFRQCGQGFVYLEMKLPENGGTLPGMFPRLELPVLKVLNIRLEAESLDLPQNEMEVFDVNDKANILLFLQSLLSRNNCLQEFSMQCDNPLPKSIPFIGLPPSVNYVKLDCGDGGPELGTLMKNPLPNLTCLTLCLRIIEDLEYVSIFFNILNKFRSTLKCFRIDSVGLENSRQALLLNFPIMEKLEKLVMDSGNFELSESSSILFPKLKKLSLYSQTQEVVGKWDSGASLCTVKSLEFQLIDEDHSDLDEKILPINLETMQSIHLAFKNISKLFLRISGKETSGLKYMFKEMRQLTALKIRLEQSQVIRNSAHWDALLIGVSEKLVAKMSDRVWEKIQKTEDTPSIRLLSELETLCLETDPRAGKKPLISNVSFSFAFLKMPKLRTLDLGGRFLVADSEKVLKEWKDKGGLIERTLWIQDGF